MAPHSIYSPFWGRQALQQKIRQHGDLGSPRPRGGCHEIKAAERHPPIGQDNLQGAGCDMFRRDEFRQLGNRTAGEKSRQQRIHIGNAQRTGRRDTGCFAFAVGEMPDIALRAKGVAQAMMRDEVFRMLRPPVAGNLVIANPFSVFCR